MIRRSFLTSTLGAIAGAVCAPLLPRPDASKYVIGCDVATKDGWVLMADVYSVKSGFRRYVVTDSGWDELEEMRAAEMPYHFLNFEEPLPC
jgi:hypothetical protein